MKDNIKYILLTAFIVGAIIIGLAYQSFQREVIIVTEMENNVTCYYISTISDSSISCIINVR
jgi:hypothetical protein